VHRMLGDHNGLVEMTFPDLAAPQFVNWIDYRARNQRANPSDVAQRVVERARAKTIWYVNSPGYRGVEGQCATLGAALENLRPTGGGVDAPSDKTFEAMGLSRYPAS